MVEAVYLVTDSPFVKKYEFCRLDKVTAPGAVSLKTKEDRRQTTPQRARAPPTQPTRTFFYIDGGAFCEAVFVSEVLQ
jgi:hypothetical protein